MLDLMNGMKRTDYCGTFTTNDEGREVVVCGWVQRQRDLGQLIFIDLRDRTGIVQLAFDDTTNRDVFDKAFGVRSEYVLMAKGLVRHRSAENNEIPTGKIEIFVTELKILGKAETPPFEILNQTDVKEDLRLKYRFLDLRRPVLQNNLMLRHKITKVVRDYYDENGFIEIETPILVKSTPEGARDYLVPSRVHEGKFFALPQSPQIYKQLLMVSGMDRYYQIARCFRDEDLRADRQPEFTQIDLEMSFVEMNDILTVNEGFIKRLFKEIMNIDIVTPITRMKYNDAIEQYGSDKPDTRFDMKIIDVSEAVKDCEFSVFSGAIANGGTVRAINAKGGASTLSRKEIDKLTEMVKGIGAKGLGYIRWVEDAPSCSFSKFMTEDEMQEIFKLTEAEKGDVVFFVADKKSLALSVLGALRLEVAKKLDIIPKNKWNFLWITEFPFFEFDEENNTYVAMHHPFTAPTDDSVQYLDSDKEKVYAKCFDLVLNGIELSSGSIRITDPALQGKMFASLGLSDEEAHEKFGFLTDAFKYGAPPHGGMAIGLDRLCMLMLGCESLREVVAFPKVANSGELMSGSPSPVDTAQLHDLSIKIIEK